MDDFLLLLQEVLRDFRDIKCRKMFGGLGVYSQGVMFGLVADEVFYLKADGKTAQQFIEQGLPPFSYRRGQKEVVLSYYQAPAEIFEDSQLAKIWAEQALQVALAAQKNKKGRKGKKT